MREHLSSAGFAGRRHQRKKRAAVRIGIGPDVDADDERDDAPSNDLESAAQDVCGGPDDGHRLRNPIHESAQEWRPSDRAGGLRERAGQLDDQLLELLRERGANTPRKEPDNSKEEDHDGGESRPVSTPGSFHCQAGQAAQEDAEQQAGEHGEQGRVDPTDEEGGQDPDRDQHEQPPRSPPKRRAVPRRR